MNKTYKSIFNKSTGTYVAVSETAKSKTKGAALVASLLLGAALPITPITAVAADTPYIQGGSMNTETNGAVLLGDSVTAAAAADAVAVGNRAQALASGSIAIGTDAYVPKNTSLVPTINNIAIGTSASATADKNVVVGAFASASGNSSVAFGYSAIATGDSAVAIGTLAKASSTSDIAIGYNAQASGGGSTALGQGAIASGLVSSAIGNKSVATGSFSSAFGDGASATAGESLATGVLSIASAGNTSVYGTRAEATKAGATAIGNRSKATELNTVAIGVNTQASLANSVSLGANSLTDSNTVYSKTSTNNGIIFGNYAGTVNNNTGFVVSVGAIGAERQIKNVASGVVSSISTDAINGSQLYATDVALGNVASSTKNILGGNAKLNPDGSLTMTNIGGTGKNTIHDAIAASQEEVVAGTNIASVVKTTDATTGVDTFTVNANGTTASAGSTAVTVTSKAGANNVTDYVVDLSDETKQSLVDADTALQTVITQIDGVEVKQLTKDDNTANFVTGKNITLTDDGLGGIEVATADNVTFTDVTTTNLTTTGVTNLGGTTNITGDTYYTGPITNGNNIVNKDYVDNRITTLADAPLNFAGDTGSVIAKKLNETLTISGKLAAAADATGANLRVDSADGKLNLVMAKDLTDLNSIVINGGPTINNQGITNLAKGDVSSTSTDAVNGSQLYAVSAVANAGWNIATDSGAAAASNVKPSDTVNFNGDGNVVVSNVGNDVTVGLADKVTIGKGGTAVTIDGTNGTIQAGTEVTIDGNTGVIQAGDVTINGDKGTVNGLSNTTWDANNFVSGQAATEDQLKVVADNVTNAIGAAKTEVEAGKNVFVSSKLGDKGQTVYTVATKDEVDFSKVTVGSLTIDKTKVDAAGNTIISGVGAGELSSTSTDAVNGSQLYATNQKVTQNTTDITNINTTLDKGLNFSADSGTTVNRKLGDTVAITGDGNITTTTTANGVQIKLSDNIDVNNVNVSQSITVAEGATVNMGGNVIQNVGAGVNGTDAVNVNQLNSVASNINNRINSVGNIANAGVAQAIATAGLPQAYLPGKSMMAVAGGTYEGETGYAIGFSTISDNGKWIIKATASGNSRDKYGASLGAGYQW